MPYTLLATTFLVNNLNDAGGGSLRQAITDANGDGSATAGSPHVINFTVSGQIDLASVLPNVNNHIIFNGHADGNIIHRNSGGNYRIFFISSGITTVMNRLSISNGNDPNGAGFFIQGSTLTLNNCTLNGNSSSNGGGIFNQGGILSLNNCTLSGNSSSNGGGIFNQGGSLTIFNTWINNNTAVSGGGI